MLLKPYKAGLYWRSARGTMNRVSVTVYPDSDQAATIATQTCFVITSMMEPQDVAIYIRTGDLLVIDGVGAFELQVIEQGDDLVISHQPIQLEEPLLNDVLDAEESGNIGTFEVHEKEERLFVSQIS